MGKFDGWLLCSDMDGTLIDDNHIISGENKKAIMYFKEQGGKFTYATGRHYKSICDKFEGLLPDLPIITVNGCGIYDFYKDEYLNLTEIRGDLKGIIKYVEQEFPFAGIEIIRPEDIVFYRENNATQRHYELEKLSQMKVISDIDKIEKPWLKLLFAQEPEETDALEQKILKSNFAKDYKLVRSHAYYYEIMDKSISKGFAIETICREYNIPRERVIAIGDNDNDLEMLKFAGISAAPSNGSDDALKEADIITRDNNNSAVADLIEKLESYI